MNDTTDHEPKAEVLLEIPLRREIVLDAETDQKFDRLVYGNQAEREMAAFWLRNIHCYAGLALGIYGSLMGGLAFVACLILTLGLSLYSQHRILAKTLLQSVVKTRIPTRVSIEVTEDGLVEMDRGVESRFGWKAMNQWFLVDGVLFIQLNNAKWAVVPEKGIEPAPIRLHDLGSFLTLKGVPGRQIDS
ncbi:MAG: hypothetical protein ACKVY0_16530 [Prosthecobacter sp.]|uniref:hypothetical protein n=1 Tax=Prosthecobacter sp. TaxID=1965333 RepID=UPI0038FE1A44